LTYEATATNHGLQAPAFAEVHRDHARFVWLALQRLGIWPRDLDDTFQEVFLVVHRRLHTFDGSSHMRSWLHGICVHVASDYRRRAHRRRETLTDDLLGLGGATQGKSPEELVAVGEERQQLRRVLDSMPPEKRAVFVMFEIDGLPCHEIGECLGVPVGTVYSRIHAARKEFLRAVKRVRANSARSEGP
jgi:RNA polymerase sigma-70 factor, ECF subfamily